MYTQVTFAQFLERLFAKAKAQRGIEFDEYPNIALNSRDGDWLYEIDNSLGVRVFRWPGHVGNEAKIAGPNWDNLKETRKEFEARFEQDFNAALDRLS